MQSDVQAIRKRLLLVQENITDAAENHCVLIQHGFEVIYEKSMHEGLHRLLFEPFDFVLLSFQAQDLHDFARCAAMRKYTDAPILVLSETDDELFNTHCMEVGVNDVLPPPHTSCRLLWKIYYVLGKCATQAPREAWSFFDEQLALEATAQTPAQVAPMPNLQTASGVTVLLLRVCRVPGELLLKPIWGILLRIRPRQRALPPPAAQPL